MTPKELRELDERATKSPWNCEGDWISVVHADGKSYNLQDVDYDDGAFFGNHENAELVVALRNLAPKLIALWEAARDYKSAQQRLDNIDGYDDLRSASKYLYNCQARLYCALDDLEE